jgi:sphingomyelin phosphodiesterase acid-like 3
LKSVWKFPGLQFTFCLWLLILIGSPLASRGQAQPAFTSQQGQRHHSADTAEAGNGTFPALLVSDIHFDPFRDPAKVQQLVDAPVSQWSSILSAPPSPNQQQAFAKLQQSCSGRGVDTPYALLHSSLRAMWSWQPDAKFMTVSGDLLAHSFSCRYTTLQPASTQSEYQAFVLKTVGFVMGELRATFPGMPVYVALGNNDSPCGDYRLDTGSDFLVRTGKIVAEGLPTSQQQQALAIFAKGGYYSLTMGAPMRNTRLIVINDVFLSPKYSTCAGRPDSTAANEEMTWLQEQLAEARRLEQKVWVMGHIPPGVDPYSTFAKIKNVCGNESPEMFLSSDRLADLLIEHADVIQLGIFAHSHMDEMRLLESQESGPHDSIKRSVAIKLVPSVSPVDGNNPAFTVARINRASAVLQNYEVIAASNQTGIATSWSREYDYAQAYHETQFSPSVVKELIAKFEDDRGANTEASQEYIRNYYVGDRSSELKPFWPLYVCALANHTAKAFAACVCSSGK